MLATLVVADDLASSAASARPRTVKKSSQYECTGCEL
jgi:hypothetical protein